jgi:hypothetical protein
VREKADFHQESHAAGGWMRFICAERVAHSQDG